MSALRSLAWEGESLRLLDQTKLPTEITYLRCRDYREVADAIRILAVRGAPAIGVAAAYAVVLAYRECLLSSDVSAVFHHACQEISAARPTAVNLSWAVSEMEKVFDRYPAKEAGDALLAKARDIEAEDIQQRPGPSVKMAQTFFQGRKGLRILTHCNTGALATAGIGTAFGVLSVLHERGAIECVYADETRPLLQGSRLTATELMEGHIPCCLISDTMSACVMRDKKIDAIIVGADRIAANGDTANKIGTYGLAVMAAYHHIPFYIAAAVRHLTSPSPPARRSSLKKEIRTKCGNLPASTVRRKTSLSIIPPSMSRRPLSSPVSSRKRAC